MLVNITRVEKVKSYSDLSIWILIVVCGVITYLIRFSFFKFASDSLIDRIKDFLSYMPAAIFSAIVAGGIFSKGLVSLRFENYKIYAVILAFVVALKFKNTILTILSGLITMWFLKTIF